MVAAWLSQSVSAIDGAGGIRVGPHQKDLTNSMAGHPELLFGVEKVLVSSQSVAGQRRDDRLAFLNADGRLVSVEIKRDWSNGATVRQLHEFAAEVTGKHYEDLEALNFSLLAG